MRPLEPTLALAIIALVAAPAAADHGWTGTSCNVEDVYDACAVSDGACFEVLADPWCRGAGAVRNATVNVTNAVVDGGDPEPGIRSAVDAVRFAAHEFCGALAADATCEALLGGL